MFLYFSIGLFHENVDSQQQQQQQQQQKPITWVASDQATSKGHGSH